MPFCQGESGREDGGVNIVTKIYGTVYCKFQDFLDREGSLTLVAVW